MEAGKDEELHQLSPPVRDDTLMTNPGSNALFSILPLQFT